MQCPRGSFWGGNPKHSSFSSQRAAPMTHLYWRRGFILFWGKQDLRSQHLLSSLALWVLEARHITAVWLKIYTLSDMFSLIFSKPYLLHFCWELFKVREWLCLNCIATVAASRTEVWILNTEQKYATIMVVMEISEVFTCPHIESEKEITTFWKFYWFSAVDYLQLMHDWTRVELHSPSILNKC